jgi:hypothetical protein
MLAGRQQSLALRVDAHHVEGNLLQDAIGQHDVPRPHGGPGRERGAGGGPVLGRRKGQDLDAQDAAPDHQLPQVGEDGVETASGAALTTSTEAWGRPCSTEAARCSSARGWLRWCSRRRP